VFNTNPAGMGLIPPIIQILLPCIRGLKALQFCAAISSHTATQLPNSRPSAARSSACSSSFWEREYRSFNIFLFDGQLVLCSSEMSHVAETFVRVRDDDFAWHLIQVIQCRISRPLSVVERERSGISDVRLCIITLGRGVGTDGGLAGLAVYTMYLSFSHSYSFSLALLLLSVSLPIAKHSAGVVVRTLYAVFFHPQCTDAVLSNYDRNLTNCCT
jgi:hypothetical protein